jgi:predicted dehydrogenase
MIKPQSRRGFISAVAGAAAGSLAGPSIMPARALGRGATPPSDRVTVGIIGSGGRGVFETGQYPFFTNVQIVAVSDAQQTRRENAKNTLEKIYSQTRPEGSYHGIDMIADFRELLARKDIDGVYIAAPDHWHVAMAMAALKAGKHVHCEKPLGVSVQQDLAARKAVRQSKKMVQYGAEGRSTRDARKAIELVLNGRIGKVQKIYVVSPPSVSGGSPTPVIQPPAGFDYDMWLGPAPVKPFCADRCLQGFQNNNGIFYIYDYCLGMIGNWAAHSLDQVQWWADHSGRKSPPVKYEGAGQIPTEGLFDVATHWDVRCTYDDGLVLHMVDNETYRKYDDAPHPQAAFGFGRPGVTAVHNGAIFIGTEGWVIDAYEKTVTSPDSLMQSVIGPNEIHLPDTALTAIPEGMSKGYQQVATAGHHQNWIQAIRTGTPPIGDLESASRSDLVSNLSELCVRTGKSLQWDPRKETIVGNDEARKMIARPMRAPWGVA